MTRTYEISNNLSQKEKEQYAFKFMKEWESYIKPQQGDILELKGSLDAAYVFYKNRWERISGT